METVINNGDALAVRVDDEILFRETEKLTFFSAKGLMGTSSESLVQVKSQLEKKKGDTIRFGYVPRLGGNGVTGSQPLEGNEQDLSFAYMDVVLERYRQAVKDGGTLSSDRPIFDLNKELSEALKVWGKEKIDLLCFNALGIGPNPVSAPGKVFYLDSAGTLSAGSAATAKANLSAANSKITPDFVRALKTWATTGGDRSYSPIRPAYIDGEAHFVLLTHDDALYDLETNPKYESYVREAAERGKNNPFFRGAKAIISNVVIRAHENCDIAGDAGGGGNVSYAKGSFMGAQALCWAWGRRPKLVKKSFDYDEFEGEAWGITAGVKRSEFNSLDYGSVGVWVSRTAISSL